MPPTDLSRPAVLLVHDGRMPAEHGVRLAGLGVVTAVVEPAVDRPAAAAQVRAAVERLRADPRVDGERIALWYFGGSAPLCAEWLRDPPPWLRCVALTDPRLEGPLEPAFRPVEAVEAVGAAAAAGVAGAMRAAELPIVLTCAGPHRPDITDFAAAARAAEADLTVVDGAGGAAAGHVLAALR